MLTHKSVTWSKLWGTHQKKHAVILKSKRQHLFSLYWGGCSLLSVFEQLYSTVIILEVPISHFIRWGRLLLTITKNIHKFGLIGSTASVSECINIQMHDFQTAITYYLLIIKWTWLFGTCEIHYLTACDDRSAYFRQRKTSHVVSFSLNKDYATASERKSSKSAKQSCRVFTKKVNCHSMYEKKAR